MTTEAASMLDQAMMKAAMQAYVDGLNRGDAEAVIALFAADAVIEDPIGTPLKSGAEIRDWFHQAVAVKARLELDAPIRGSHGNAAAMAFTLSMEVDGRRVRIRSLDACTFDADGLITELKAYWGPDDVEM